ncbi:MAG: DnaJ domain-containing protein [Myxococcota bacterium]
MSVTTLDPETVPRLRDGIDITRAGLSLEEGFLVSRVDGRTSIAQLAVLVGKPLEETTQIAERLALAQILVAGDTATESTEDDPWEGYEFPFDAMIEDVDLDDEEKKRILFTHGHLDAWTHYRLLEVRWRDDAKTIQRAYYARSKEWHPDRFRRPRLGTFKARIDEIFRAINAAYSELRDAQRKRKYDREHAPAFDEEDMAAMLKARRREDRDARRVRERLERRRRSNPIRKRMEQARRLYEQASELRDRGELMQALNTVQAAATFDERPEYRRLCKELQIATAELRVAPIIKRGLHAENMTSWEDAITLFGEAVRLAPEHGQARLRLSYNMLMGGRPAQTASEHITHALRLLPEEPEAHFVRGLCYEKGLMEKAAIRAYERALELKPNYAEAKKRLKKLRWGF